LESRNDGEAERQAPAPALYAHLPFCRSRCSYCAFASGLYEESLADAYLEALAEELRRRRIFYPSRPPSSVYLGGGTPSALSLRQLDRLFALLPAPAEGGECSCELNPDSCAPDKLRLLRQRGVNRCSFGVQTFSARGLEFLERRHDAAAARRCLEEAGQQGFASLSLDLISGWPGQDLGSWLEDLRLAASLGVSHVSCYALSLEPDSRLALKWPKIAAESADAFGRSEEESLAFWREGEAFLASRGFVHYETSNFARPGFCCRHNLNVWKGGEYLGLGAAAHSHLNGRRHANVRDAAAYVERLRRGQSPEEFSETLPPREKAREAAVFWLRLFEGIDLDEFQRRTGFAFDELYARELPPLLAQGWLRLDEAGRRVRVPAEFQPLLDAILPELV
jgi:oxygen-independent coproporphyrinogen-3 oxidase